MKRLALALALSISCAEKTSPPCPSDGFLPKGSPIIFMKKGTDRLEATAIDCRENGGITELVLYENNKIHTRIAPGPSYKSLGIVTGNNGNAIYRAEAKTNDGSVLLTGDYVVNR